MADEGNLNDQNEKRETEKTEVDDKKEDEEQNVTESSPKKPTLMKKKVNLNAFKNNI